MKYRIYFRVSTFEDRMIVFDLFPSLFFVFLKGIALPIEINFGWLIWRIQIIRMDTNIASDSLKGIWDNPTEDKAWKDL